MMIYLGHPYIKQLLTVRMKFIVCLLWHLHAQLTSRWAALGSKLTEKGEGVGLTEDGWGRTLRLPLGSFKRLCSPC